LSQVWWEGNQVEAKRTNLCAQLTSHTTNQAVLPKVTHRGLLTRLSLHKPHQEALRISLDSIREVSLDHIREASLDRIREASLDRIREASLDRIREANLDHIREVNLDRIREAHHLRHHRMRSKRNLRQRKQPLWRTQT